MNSKFRKQGKILYQICGMLKFNYTEKLDIARSKSKNIFQ